MKALLGEENLGAGAGVRGGETGKMIKAVLEAQGEVVLGT